MSAALPSLEDIKKTGANAFWDDIPSHENPYESGYSHRYGFEQEWRAWINGWNMAESELKKPAPITRFEHGEQFWSKDHYPSPPSQIPHPRFRRKLWCFLTLGHRWASMLWAGMDEPGWPNLDYCEKCWKFRRKKEAKPKLGEGPIYEKESL